VRSTKADRAGVLDLADVGRVLHEGAARPGAATLTETDLEELLLAIVRRAGLPEPIDGPAHDTPAGRVHDARRDVRLQNAGWRVLRFSKREILGDPAYVANAIGQALCG
jgi:hypothetical protein